MFLIRVIPLAKLPPNAPSVLDYFWSDRLHVGSLVRAMLGRRSMIAAVVDVQDIRTAKLALKNAGFELKKLSGVVTNTPQMTETQIQLARWISSQYACSLASALKTVLPASIGKPRSLVDHSVVAAASQNTQTSGTVFITQPDTARSIMADIVGATQGQVLICVPERQIAESLVSDFPRGTVCVHSGLTATALRAVYRGVLDGSVRIVVGTRIALFLPWSSLSHIIVEDPLNEMYKSDMSPRYNAPDVARHLAHCTGANLTWLTPAISTVQYSMKESGTLAVDTRKPYWPVIRIASAQGEAEAGHRSMFSREATETILNSFERREKLLVFSSRRAYATVARCTRCATAVQCATCDIPMRWHRTAEDMLVCYHCAAFLAVPKQCQSCHAGILKPSGTPGSQKLVEALNVVLDRAGYPKQQIPILDSDLVREPGDALRIFESFDSMRHPILIATSMIHAYRYDRTFDTIVIPHVDMLISSPDYRTQDRLILQLEKLADLHPSSIVLQSYNDEPLVTLALHREWDSFFKEELVHRKSLRWPPYTRIIKLSFRHRDKTSASRAARAGAERLTRAVAHVGAKGTDILGPAPALVEHAAGMWTFHVIIKSSLTSSRLAEFLRYVPDGWTVDVDPRSIA